MHFRRRQHNATLPPDGTVPVTGGTQGGGGPTNGFNDVPANQPVHAAELGDPASQEWTLLAAEEVDRCYHSTAVLLPDAKDSVAYLYLNHDGLPDIENWPAEFEQLANGSYLWRGVEITLRGNIMSIRDDLFVTQDQGRPDLALAPLQPSDKVQLNVENGAPKPLPDVEKRAFDNLSKLKESSAGTLSATVTGPLKKVGVGFVLEVRKFE